MMTKTEASRATIQSATNIINAGRPYEDSAAPMRAATFSIPLALARPAVTASAALCQTCRTCEVPRAGDSPGCAQDAMLHGLAQMSGD